MGEDRQCTTWWWLSPCCFLQLAIPRPKREGPRRGNSKASVASSAEAQYKRKFANFGKRVKQARISRITSAERERERKESVTRIYTCVYIDTAPHVPKKEKQERKGWLKKKNMKLRMFIEEAWRWKHEWKNEWMCNF